MKNEFFLRTINEMREICTTGNYFNKNTVNCVWMEGKNTIILRIQGRVRVDFAYSADDSRFAGKTPYETAMIILNDANEKYNIAYKDYTYGVVECMIAYILKTVFFAFVWQLIEILDAGTIEQSLADNIIFLVLSYYIAKSQITKFFQNFSLRKKDR